MAEKATHDLLARTPNARNTHVVRGGTNRRNAPAANLIYTAALLSVTLFACGRAAKPPQAVPAATLGLRESFEPAPEFGGTVHVLQAGPEHAPALVLIHGVGSRAARDFDPIVPELSQNHHVFAFDLPGFGHSSHDRTLYTPSRYVRFIHELLHRHFDAPVDVLGHSMGGTLAIAYAARYPNHVAHLALLDVAGILYYRDYLLNVGSRAAQRKDVFEGVWSDARDTLLRAALSLTSLEALHLEQRDALPSYLSATGAATLMLIGHDFTRELHRIAVPTWIGWGANDTVAPQRTERALRFLLQPARVAVFAESAHVPMRTEPEHVTQSLQAFLAQNTPKPKLATLAAPHGRTGNCVNQHDRLFEGDYERIVIHNCERVLLRNVRAGSIWIDASRAELRNVEIVAEAGAGAVFNDSQVLWTGGRMSAPVCFDASASQLDLAAVSCEAQDAALRVHEPSRLVASVSWFNSPKGVRTLHGDYSLGRTTPDRAAAPSDAELIRWQQQPPHREPRFDVVSWAGRKLVGEDLTGADLPGARLEGAQLEGAQRTGAVYNQDTRFSSRFDPSVRGPVRERALD